MKVANQEYDQWVQYLQQKQLDQLVFTLLQAAKPFNLLISQSIYLLQPFTGKNQLLINLFENQDSAKYFLSSLSQKETNG